MTFKKGDRVRTEDGHAGLILFVDKNCQEAQVALAKVTMKIRTESLQMLDDEEMLANASSAVASGRPAARKRVRRTAKP